MELEQRIAQLKKQGMSAVEVYADLRKLNMDVPWVLVQKIYQEV